MLPGIMGRPQSTTKRGTTRKPHIMLIRQEDMQFTRGRIPMRQSRLMLRSTARNEKPVVVLAVVNITDEDEAGTERGR